MTDTPTENQTDLLATDTPAAPLATVAPDPVAFLQAALQSERSPEELQQLHELYQSVQADHARAAFNRAFVKFKRGCPPIPRTRRTTQYKRVTDDGRTVDGSYADLEGIEKVVGPVLLDCGLSYRWIDTKVVDGDMVVVCRLAHVDGHYEDSPSPPFPMGQVNAGQSKPQASASVSTFARRYSLVSGLGLTTVDEDDDGRGENSEPAETITEEQARELNDMLIEATRTKGECEAWTDRMLKRAGVSKLAEVPVTFHDEFAKKLQGKIDADRSEGT